MTDKMKILIIEDSKLLQAVMQDALQNAGFEVYQADNGLLGLETAKQIHPDLILLDVMMPVMDGLTTYQELRKDDWGKTVSVIMLTGAEEDRVTSWISQEGLDYFKKDNWMMNEVVSHIKQKLGISK